GLRADMDGDGDQDLLLHDNEDVWVLVNDGHGVLRKVAAASSTTYIRSVLAGDLDGDGRPDAMVLNAACPTGVLFVQNGGGLEFREASSLGWPAAALSSASAADLAADGSVEITALDITGDLSVHSLGIRARAADCNSNGIPDDCEAD